MRNNLNTQDSYESDSLQETERAIKDSLILALLLALATDEEGTNEPSLAFERAMEKVFSNEEKAILTCGGIGNPTLNAYLSKFTAKFAACCMMYLKTNKPESK